MSKLCVSITPIVICASVASIIALFERSTNESINRHCLRPQRNIQPKGLTRVTD